MKTEGADRKKEQPAASLPIMLEAAFTFSKIGVLTVGTLIFSLTIFNGDGPLAASLRAGIAVIALGIMVWFADWILARYSLDTLKPETEKSPDSPLAESTIEKEA